MPNSWKNRGKIRCRAPTRIFERVGEVVSRKPVARSKHFLRSKLCAACTTAAQDDLAASAGLSARAKTMRAGAFTLLGLVGSFRHKYFELYPVSCAHKCFFATTPA